MQDSRAACSQERSSLCIAKGDVELSVAGAVLGGRLPPSPGG